MHPAGSADLVLVSLPAQLLLGRQQQHTHQPDKQLSELSAADVLTASAVVLRPGGYLIAVLDGDGPAGTMRAWGA